MSNIEVDTPVIVKSKKSKSNVSKSSKVKNGLKAKSGGNLSASKASDLISNGVYNFKDDDSFSSAPVDSMDNISSTGLQLQDDVLKTNGTDATDPVNQSSKKPSNGSLSEEPKKKRKISKAVPYIVSKDDVSLTELSKLDPVTYCLRLIKQSIKEDNKVLFESHLLKTTAFVIDKVVLHFDKEIAQKFIAMLYEILKSYNGTFKVLKHWTQSVLKYHGPVVFKNQKIVETFQKFIASSDSRIESFNCLSKLSSRLDLILSQRKLMVASRKAELAKDLCLDSLTDSEGTSEPSSGELSLDDEFYLNKSKLNDSDFLGHGDSSSEYETADEDLPTSVNGRLKRKSFGSGGE